MRLVLAILAISASLIILAVLVRHVIDAVRQMRNVKTVRGLGARVIYDFQMHRSAREWLIHCDDTWWSRFFGPDFCGTIEHISMSPDFSAQRAPNSGDVAFLASSFKGLRGLLLEGREFGDEACSHIARMRFLEKLWLNNTDVSDHGLRQLSGLKSLTELRILQSQISAGALAELRRALPRCKVEIK